MVPVTTVGSALEILQKIARGTNRVGELVKPKDFTRGLTDVPMRFEVEAELPDGVYGYALALELPEKFKELRVLEERLTVDGKTVYTREIAQVHLAKWGQDKTADFVIDWHLVALPILQLFSPNDPISVFKQWLGHMLILRPMPRLISGESELETLQPNPTVTDIGAWFTGLLALAPSSYSGIDGFLKQVMPDIKEIRNPLVGQDSRSMSFQFANEKGTISIPFEEHLRRRKMLRDLCVSSSS